MKKIYSSLLLFCCSLLFLAAQDTYLVNTELSLVEWTGRKITGEHQGLIQLKEGNFTFNNGTITKGEFIMNMQSISVSDIKDQEQNAKLVGVLNAPGFFDVENFPIGKLRISKSEKIADDKLRVFAELELKTTTLPIAFEASLLQEGSKMVAIGEMEINRTNYDIAYGTGSLFDALGDKAIKDIFTVKFKVAAIQQ